MDPSTKPGPGAGPHETWRNRDYVEAEEAARPRKYRWLRITAAVLSLFMLFGLLWGSLQPLLQ